MKTKRDIRKTPHEQPLCECGCGKPVKQARNGTYNKFIVGHNPKRTSNAKPANTGNTGQYKAGQSGNPKGRPQGSRNKASIAVENLFLNEAEQLSRQCIELALSGNLPALKLCIERICPVRKSTPVKLPDLPKVNSVADASDLTGFILDAVASGRLSPVDGEIISRSADRHLKALQVSDLEHRLAELETKLLGQDE